MCREGTIDDYVVKEVLSDRVNSYQGTLKIKPGDRVLDLGANIGVLSTLALSLGAEVLAIEADEENTRLARDNAAMNGFNLNILNRAVAKNSGETIEFFLNKKKNKGAHSSLVKRGREKTTSVTISINELLADFRPNKIKCDIEGAEEETLFAIQDWTGIEAIVLEWHFAILRENKVARYEKMVELLKSKFKNVRSIPVSKIGKNWHCIVSADNF